MYQTSTIILAHEQYKVRGLHVDPLKDDKTTALTFPIIFQVLRKVMFWNIPTKEGTMKNCQKNLGFAEHFATKKSLKDGVKLRISWTTKNLGSKSTVGLWWIGKIRSYRSMIGESVRDKALESKGNLRKFSKDLVFYDTFQNQTHLPSSSIPNAQLLRMMRKFNHCSLPATDAPGSPWCLFFYHQKQQLSVWSIQKADRSGRWQKSMLLVSEYPEVYVVWTI